jgi:hypothetical protein
VVILIKSQIGIENFTRNILRKCNKPFPVSVDNTITVNAEVNHGRLIAKCPFCPGAELVDRNDKRFFCLSCFNKKVNGKWLPIIIPENLDEIETILNLREEQNQNWIPGETAEMLKSEVV